MLIPLAVLALAGISAYLLYRSWRHAVEVADLADQVHELRGKVRLFSQYGPKL